MAFEADANEIIEDQSQTIAALHKQVSIMKSQLKNAEAQIAAHEKAHEEASAEEPSKKPAKAVA